MLCCQVQASSNFYRRVDIGDARWRNLLAGSDCPNVRDFVLHLESCLSGCACVFFLPTYFLGIRDREVEKDEGITWSEQCRDSASASPLDRSFELTMSFSTAMAST